MRYGSVCSGIEAATVAWHPLGWEPVWFSEIESFPCKVLKHHYPNVPNLGDMLHLTENEIFNNEPIDLLVGGTPCQSFSTAGLRAGLASANGNLALEYCRILLIKRPTWFVWENVPGALSSFSYEEGSGRVGGMGGLEGTKHFTETSDFATILQAFRECGYSCAYRVLDAQYFGVPQQRRRVFVVGYFGDDWRPPAAVLFEPQSLRRDTPKGRKKRKAVAALTKTGVGTCGADDNQAQAGHIVTGTIDASYGRLQGASGQDGGHGHSTLVYGGNNTKGPIDVATAVNACKSASGRMDFESESFVMPINTQIALREHKQGDRTGMGIGENGAPQFTLGKNHHHAVCYPYNQIAGKENRSNPQPGDASCTLSKRDCSPLLIPGVRRLTPLECERLQGFPDDYTLLPGAADSPRYESIGNSMARPVMAWIGRRIGNVDKQMKNI